jgi:hypothetical protein
MSESKSRDQTEKVPPPRYWYVPFVGVAGVSFVFAVKELLTLARTAGGVRNIENLDSLANYLAAFFASAAMISIGRSRESRVAHYAAVVFIGLAIVSLLFSIWRVLAGIGGA